MAKRIISQKEYQQEREKNPKALDYPQVLEQGVMIDIQYTNWVVVKNKFPYVEFDDKKVVSHYLLVSKDNSIESFTDLEDQDLKDIQDNIQEMKKQVGSDHEVTILWKEANNQEMKKFHIHLIVTVKSL